MRWSTRSFSVVARRMERAGGEQVGPEALALVADAVPEHDVLAHGEPHEQLELLEGACEPEA